MISNLSVICWAMYVSPYKVIYEMFFLQPKICTRRKKIPSQLTPKLIFFTMQNSSVYSSAEKKWVLTRSSPLSSAAQSLLVHKFKVGLFLADLILLKIYVEWKINEINRKWSIISTILFIEYILLLNNLQY